MRAALAGLTATALAVALVGGCSGTRDEISLALESASDSSRFDLASDRSQTPRVSGTARLEVILPPTPLRGAGGLTCHEGKVLVAEPLMNRISSVAPDGATTRVATPHGFSRPVDLAIDDRETLFVASDDPGGIWRRDANGSWDRMHPELGPVGGIALGPNGQLWVAECSQRGRLLEMSTEDDALLTERATDLGCPGRLHIEADGSIVMPFVESGEVQAFDPTTATLESLARGLDIPTAAAATPDGSLVVLESGTGRIIPLTKKPGGTSRPTLVRLTPGIADLELCGSTVVVSNSATGALDAFKPWPYGKRGLAPVGLVLASSILVDGGDLLIADQASIKRVRRDRLELVVPTRPDGMSSAVGLAGGLPGLAWVTSPERGELRQVDLTRGESSRIVSGLSWPTSVLRTRSGDLIIAETGAGRVVQIGLGAIPYTLASGLLSPVGLAMRGQRVITAEPTGGRVLGIRPGEAPSVVETGLAAPAGLTAAQGRPIYIAEERRGRILARARNGSVRTIAEGLALRTPESYYPLPVPIVVGLDGAILVASPENGSLLRIVPN